MHVGAKRLSAPSGPAVATRRVKPRANFNDFRKPPFCPEQLNALVAAQNLIHGDIVRAFDNVRSNALHAIAETVQATQFRDPTESDVVAIMLQLGPAAVSGDRAQAFDAVLSAACSACETDVPEIVRLQSELHSSFSCASLKIDQALRASLAKDDGGIVLIAVEDADRFPRETLRDMVYICGRRDAGHTQFTSLKRRHRTTLFIFGLAISPSVVHSALGVSEASMIAPITICMPSNEEYFHAVVGDVLRDTKHPVMLSSDVFSKLREEFLRGEASITMLERALQDIYAIQFMDFSLMTVISDPDVLPPYLLFKHTHLPSNLSIRECDASLQNDNKFDQSRVMRKVKFLKRMTEAHANDIVAAQDMPSVSKNLLDNVIVMYEGMKCLDRDEVNCNMNGAPAATRRMQHNLDSSSIKNLTFTWYEKLTEWRWIAKVVENVLWNLIETLEFTNVELSKLLPHDNNVDKLGKRRLRSLLFEQMLPGHIPSVEQDISHAPLSKDVRKTVLVAVRRKLSLASLPQLKYIVRIWIESLSFFATNPEAPTNTKMWACIAHLESLKARVDAQLHFPSDLANIIKMKGNAAQAGSCACNDTNESDTCHLCPASRSKFDSAVHGAESGTRLARKRASGGAAAKEKRLKAFNEASQQVPTQEGIAQIRNSACHIYNFMLDLITPLQELALHDIAVFKHCSKLKLFSSFKCHSAEPRSCFLQAMRAPHLDHGCLSSLEVPDVADAYRVLAESGRIVNLSDWYHSFTSVRWSATIANLADEHRATSELNPQAGNAKLRLTGYIDRHDGMKTTSKEEFARAVPTLEFLGVVKHARRRTDHVVRLVYE